MIVNLHCYCSLCIIDTVATFLFSGLILLNLTGFVFFFILYCIINLIITTFP